MWQTLEIISTLVIPVMLHSHPLYQEFIILEIEIVQLPI